jgi:tetratricopeptide (TPR) repeat protein
VKRGRSIVAGGVAALWAVALLPVRAALPQTPGQPSEEPPEALLRQARTLAQAGSIAEAEPLARGYLLRRPTSSEGHFLLGYILFKADRPKDSLAEYTSGAKYGEPGAGELKVVALDYVLLEDYPDAEHWLKEALARDAHDAESWYYLGRTQYNENHFADAVAAFGRCLQLDPRHVKAEANLGLALQGLQRNAEAEAAYRLAISWEQAAGNSVASGKTAEPYIDLGGLLLEENKNEEAVQFLLRGAEIAPGEFRVREKLGTAYFRLDDLGNAQAQLEQAVALAPQNAAMHYMLGQTYRKQGQPDKARVEFERATALNGAHGNLGTMGPGSSKP